MLRWRPAASSTSGSPPIRDDPETDSGTKPRVLEDGSLRPREKRIDFLLLAGAGRARPLAMRRDFLPSDLVVDGAPLGDLSNHAALLAEIAWRRAGRPSAPAAADRSIAAVVAPHELRRELAARAVLGQRLGAALGRRAVAAGARRLDHQRLLRARA